MTVAEAVARALGTKKVVAFIIIAAALPFVIYALMSSITIEPTPEFVELGWVRYNKPGWVLKQTAALYILTILVIGVLLSWRHKLAIAMLAFALTLLMGIVEIDLMIEYMNMPVILFLASMMLIVEVVKETGFLRQIINKIIEVTNFEPGLLIVATLVLSAVLAALVDAVVSIVVMVSMVISLAEALEIDPKPLIVASIVATNIGSSATVVGNPVGIYLALRAGLSFSDFLVWATPPALLSMMVVVLFLMRKNRDYIAKARVGIAEKLRRGMTLVPSSEEEVSPLTGAVLLAVTLAGIAAHSAIEKALGLPENALLLGIPM
ncbi:TPA: hypothetical protein EYP38_01310 [Candidatus Micrarchaeota archaeon]|nr:hypothetical protein [Candidatus Micrarchaeota archaeon]